MSADHVDVFDGAPLDALIQALPEVELPDGLWDKVLVGTFDDSLTVDDSTVPSMDDLPVVPNDEYDVDGSLIDESDSAPTPAESHDSAGDHAGATDGDQISLHDPAPGDGSLGDDSLGDHSSTDSHGDLGDHGALGDHGSFDDHGAADDHPDLGF